MNKEIKVVLIGAASCLWGFTVTRDLLVALSDKEYDEYIREFVLEDIDRKNLERVYLIALKMNEKLGRKVKIVSTTNPKKAIEGARMVVVSLAVGSLESMLYDIEIPSEYGIYQPVGDTISIGGAMRAARNTPAVVGIAKDMERYAARDAWMLNLSNPMSILCRAVTKETKANVIGWCHELYGGLDILARWLDFKFDEWRNVLDIEVLGINHCGWLKNIRYRGKDGFEKMRMFLKLHGITRQGKKLYNSPAAALRRLNVKINLFLRHGVFPYSGDRHIGEFFTEFINKSTNKGADYGILLTSPQERLVDLRGRGRESINKMLEDGNIDYSISMESTSRIMNALILGKSYYDVGNLPYHGNTLSGIPDGAVLERMCNYSKNSAIPCDVSPLPKELQAHLTLHAQNIEYIVEASVTGNRAIMLKALYNDPLLKNMNRKKIPEMLDRLLKIHQQYINPNFLKK